jgi:hypothetical protein
MIPDIGWIWDPLVGEQDLAGAQTAALKGAKGARAGTKAGRAVRIVRLVRMVRIVKLYKMTAGDEDVDVEEDTGAEPSKVGKKLTELTTRKVIIITLVSCSSSFSPPSLSPRISPSRNSIRSRTFLYFCFCFFLYYLQVMILMMAILDQSVLRDDYD